jgi:hypothetical protein
MPTLLGLPAWLLRVAARGLLVALSVSACGPVAHGMHEDDCDPAIVIHDQAQHHVQAAASDNDELPANHCVACHFARSPRGHASWQLSGLTALDPGVLLYHSDGQLHTASISSTLPARAPPALA